jgi:hypothetical protein
LKPNAPKSKGCVYCAMAYTRCKECVNDSEFKPFGPNFMKIVSWEEIPNAHEAWRDIPNHALGKKR